MEFLPTDYKNPSNNHNYVKLQDGETRVRILSKPIVGWEDWIDNRPVRYEMNKKPAKPHDANKPLRHFWSMIVWNYNDQMIQILHITQAKIRKGLIALTSDKDWGAPYFYDIKIVKTGQKKETDYQVNPVPHKPLDPAIKEIFEDRKCWLPALFEGLDPFAETWHEFTEGIFVKPEESKPIVEVKIISTQQYQVLNEMIGEDKDYRSLVLSTLTKRGINRLEDIPVEIYPQVLQGAQKNQELKKLPC